MTLRVFALGRAMLPLLLSMAAICPRDAISALHTPADVGVAQAAPQMLPMPRKPSILPRTHEEWLYDLAPSEQLRPELMTPEMRREQPERARAASAEKAACPSMSKLASYRGADFAEQVAGLPDSSCANAFFSVPRAQAQSVFAVENLQAVAGRFEDEGALYRSPNRALVKLSLFLRAAYYLADNDRIAPVPSDVSEVLRPAIMQLVTGDALFEPNEAAPTTAGEVVALIINMHDEAAFLDVMKQWVERFTNSPASPNAARKLDDANAGYGFTAILKVFYFAQMRPDASPRIENDPSYAEALYAFVKANKQSLLRDRHASYHLNQAATEAFRFAKHPALLPTVGLMMRDALAESTMAGPERLIWLAAAEAVRAYDNANCASYGTCDFEKPLAEAILSKTYSCANGAIRMRMQSLNPGQAAQACSTMLREAPYFHAMLGTNNIAAANDHNKSLEVIVFANNVEYENYSGVLFGNDTNNGGVYLEGDPAVMGNVPRFIAYEATWLRPRFEIWNLKHEFVHYLDGRFNMYGDFDASTKMPAVWYIEGLAEYISRGNDDPESINAAKTGQYRLRDIFRNTYSMDDYVNRTYRWGYMAVRFVFERHPEVLATILPMFRAGDYDSYWAYMKRLPAQLDEEFAQWVTTVTTSGTPTPPWRGN